ncbi:hypothetical protein [Nonomuraea jiangxiensis]|uniref:hypothetical protein n=1 Tax=Nonomuraea jiangxiensis TaxID=633440 RepID=UPI000B8453C9|nr:hypothetical protein [Nonomuraea jiangxiensis]
MGQPAGQWADDTDRALRTKWDDPKKLEAMLKGVPAGERRTWWVQQLVRYAGERTATFHLAVDARRRELAEQMFALLQAMEPRPAEAEVARPTAEFRSMVAGLAPAGTAGRDLLAMAADIDAALTEVVDRAPTLDELRAGRIVQLTSACEGPRTDLAHVDQVVTGLTAMDTPALAKAFVELDVDAPALQALRAAIPDERHVGDQADQALRGKLEQALRGNQVTTLSSEELRQTLAAPFEAAMSAARAVQPKTSALKAAVDARVALYDRYFGRTAIQFDRGAGFRIERFVVRYGRPAAQAMYDWLQAESAWRSDPFLAEADYMHAITIAFERYGFDNPTEALIRETLEAISAAARSRHTDNGRVNEAVDGVCSRYASALSPSEPE